MATDKLREALRLAHDRLDDDSDSYADEDLLATLVEAVEDAERHDLAGQLARFAQNATLVAERLLASPEGSGKDAAAWMVAARQALEARAHAPATMPAGMPEDERAAAAAVVRNLRVGLEGAQTEAGAHKAFLADLLGTFVEAGTPTATRVAARIEGHLARFGHEHEQRGEGDGDS